MGHTSQPALLQMAMGSWQIKRLEQNMVGTLNLYHKYYIPDHVK
jgi:hypothetical protein